MSAKRVVLTIDDGPTEHFLRKCDYLQKNNIKAVFFCIGQQLEAMPDMAINAIRNGFIIGNHSYSHPHFSDLSLTDAFKEVEKTHIIIDGLYKAADIPRPVNWFRFPFGDNGDGCYGKVFSRPRRAGKVRRQVIQFCLQQLGYTQPEFHGITYPFYRKASLLTDIDWHWTFDIMEWNLRMPRPDPGFNTSEKILQRLESNRPKDCRGLHSRDKRWIGNPHSEEIILLHDHIETTELFFRIIDKLLSLPLQFGMP
ncbi:MAG TPA: polysaccharide deacetylase family protein [Flavisolibacter sp.]|nr:polysaccharide deacetylase family protein [Flavisolibacter sp.]